MSQNAIAKLQLTYKLINQEMDRPRLIMKEAIKEAYQILYSSLQVCSFFEIRSTNRTVRSCCTSPEKLLKHYI